MPAVIGVQLALLLLAHLLGDFYGSFYGPLVPHLREQLGLSLTMTTVMATAYVSMSNFMQPLFGAMGERYGRRRILVAGVLCSTVGMSLLTTPGRFHLPQEATFVCVLIALLVGSMGIGMFHPSGAAISGGIAGGRRSSGLSLYMVGGNIGVMLAPLVIPWMVNWRPENILFLAIPGVAAALLLGALLTPDAPALRQKASAHPLHLWRILRKVWPIHLDVILRFTPLNAYAAMLPLYGTLCGYSLVRSGQMLALFMFAGALGVISGGFLAERFPGRGAIAFSELGAGVCLVAAPAVHLWPLQLALLFIGAFLVYSVTPLQIANAQRRVPGDVAAASGIVMGLAYGNAGLLLIPLGMLGDHFGAAYASERIALQYILQLSATTLFLAAALVFFIKMPEHGDVSADPGRMDAR